MPKRVAIIDIGSNSLRLVIFQRTSRFGFHLINQLKSNARISEGSFENKGYLQPKAIARTISTLSTFQDVIKDYKAKKTLVIATAAVRNAPNRLEFLKEVREKTKLNIKVIDGKKEAFLAAVAAKNLLPISNAVTIDIGGGSSDIALIKDEEIIDTISLNIGTITIKELFLDKNKSIEEAREFIKKEISKIPPSFKGDKIVAIGGVLRALAKSIMELTNYSFKKIHAFEYSFSNFTSHFENILNAKDNKELKKLFIKESRFDTIKSGLLIFKEIVEHLKIDNIITSGVGIREGLFLYDMLRGVGGKFPKELNPSIVSINDRFDLLKLPIKYKVKIVKELFNTLSSKANLDSFYLKHLTDATKISNIGKTLTIYEEHKHAYYIASQELNWKYTHKDMLLIAIILRSKGDKLIYKPLKKEHKSLLPSKKIIKWLGFIYTLSDILFSYSYRIKYHFEIRDNSLI
ncbi:MAG: Ppx/GppA family phosphatase, partial [Epsilonproteobacteria bacterium]|nr:Ppx/GppA family phosphatase [Campylobacterota bacterium]